MAASPGSTPVAFAGLGNIGRPMALALIRAGWSLTVYDPVPEKATGLGDEGASVASSPEELSSCEVLVLAVPDDAAVESLLEGPKGWLAQEGADRTVVVHSTVLPATASRLAEAASDCGVGLLDAPVSRRRGPRRARRPHDHGRRRRGGARARPSPARDRGEPDPSRGPRRGRSGDEAREPADDAVGPRRRSRGAGARRGPRRLGGERSRRGRLVHGRVLGDAQLGLLRPDVRRLRRRGHVARGPARGARTCSRSSRPPARPTSACRSPRCCPRFSPTGSSAHAARTAAAAGGAR